MSVIHLQKPTVIFVNGALCLSTVLVLGSLSLSGLPEDLTFHLSILLSLMIGLLVAFNWYGVHFWCFRNHTLQYQYLQ